MAARKRAKQNQSKVLKQARRRNRKQKHKHKPAKSKAATSNACALNELRDWLLPGDKIFAGLKRHGNTEWLPIDLVWLALCWAWEESKNVTDAFDEAKDQCGRLGIAAPGTYQGMMKALVRWTGPLMITLWCVIQQRMQKIGAAHWQIDGWVPIAFDGSRSSAPRTASNEAALCAPNYGNGMTAKYRKKKSKGMRRRNNKQNKPQPPEPQAWITLLWHMGLRLPWTWRLGPSNSSERAHVQQMLEEGDFPQNTLFCGDAGFVGYSLWSRILQRKAHFLVRVGANVNLLHTSKDFRVKSPTRVLCWPQEAQRKNLPPLELRLLKIKVGKTQMWMLTSVLDSRRLPKMLIARFYRMRWGVEVEFRGLKQTLDCAKLSCRNDERVRAELNWSILAMAVAELFALKKQLAAHRGKRTGGKPQNDADPWKRSLAGAVRALRRCLRRLDRKPAPGEDLATQLRLAVTDSYHRKSSKKARYRPPNPDKKPLSDPQLRPINDQEKNKLKTLAAPKTVA